MKKIFWVFLLTPLFFACDNSKTEEQTGNNETIDLAKERNQEENTTAKELKFDMNTIPVSNEDIGDFPFFTAPEGSKYINKPKVKEFDFIVFVTPDSIYEVEGKTFRSHVQQDRKSNIEVSARLLNKSFEDAILGGGGVKVFEGKLNAEQKERYKTLATYAGSNGSLDVWNNEIAMYVIRRNDGNVYIALDKGKIGTSIQIVQEKAFEQTIQKITSAKIENDLLNAGKSVLHINFDTDKATLKSSGLETVQEIIKVLSKNPELKIAINGYTDNSGTKAHNQKLSEERALTVKNEIVKSGINAERLTSKGFGQDNPIAGNDTEEGKSQNRRVELVKL